MGPVLVIRGRIVVRRDADRPVSHHGFDPLGVPVKTNIRIQIGAARQAQFFQAVQQGGGSAGPVVFRPGPAGLDPQKVGPLEIFSSDHPERGILEAFQIFGGQIVHGEDVQSKSLPHAFEGGVQSQPFGQKSGIKKGASMEHLHGPDVDFA